MSLVSFLKSIQSNTPNINLQSQGSSEFKSGRYFIDTKTEDFLDLYCQYVFEDNKTCHLMEKPFNDNNIQVVIDKVEKAGGKVLIPKTEAPFGLFSIILDTEGNRIGLHAEE